MPSQSPKPLLKSPTGLLVVAAVVMAALAGLKSLRQARPGPVSVGTSAAPDAVPPDAGSQPTRLHDFSAEAGLAVRHVNGPDGQFWIPQEMGPGAAFLDYDDDGDMDLYLVQSGNLPRAADDPRNRLFANDGHGRFRDVSEGSGADIGGYGLGCAAADADQDGDVDLFITRLGADVLLLNDGDGAFSDATAASGISSNGFGTGACFFDYDRDGRTDLYVANYVQWAPDREKRCYDPAGSPDFCSPTEYEAPGMDRLFRNVGGGRFEDTTVASGVASVSGNSLGLVCADLDGDRWLDVFVASDQTPGLLWMNRRDGTFREDAALRGCAFSADGLTIAGMGTAAEDYDGDGDLDLLITNLHDLIHLALRNDGGVFEDVSHAWGVGGWGVPFTGFGVASFDQDHDGLMDLFVGNGAVLRLGVALFPGYDYAEPNQFITWTAAGHFVDASDTAGPALRQPGTSRAVVRGDIDNDGDLDIVVTNNGGPVQLLRNDAAASGAWIVLDLVPAQGGRLALNARVEVQAGGRRWIREVLPHTSYLSSHDPRVHVGLGNASQVDRLTVTWPSGRRETWAQLPVNHIQQLHEGTGTTSE